MDEHGAAAEVPSYYRSDNSMEDEQQQPSSSYGDTDMRGHYERGNRDKDSYNNMDKDYRNENWDDDSYQQRSSRRNDDGGSGRHSDEREDKDYYRGRMYSDRAETYENSREKDGRDSRRKDKGHDSRDYYKEEDGRAAAVEKSTSRNPNSNPSSEEFRSDSDKEPRRHRKKSGERHHKKKRHHKEKEDRDYKDDRHHDRHHHHRSRHDYDYSDNDNRTSRSRSRSGSRRSRRHHRGRYYSDEDNGDGYSGRKYYNSRSRSRSDESDWGNDYHKNRYQEPNSSIMIRGLAPHLSESDIRQGIEKSGYFVKDVRVIRNRDTGVSRGFAFVDFNALEDAKAWMEEKNGVFTLQDKYTTNLIYSSNHTYNERAIVNQIATDWFCPNCQAHNFKKRSLCYQCRTTRPDEDSEANEISTQPTSTVMLGNLDALTVEENVLQAFQKRPGLSHIPMRSVRIGRDRMTNLTLGVCYVDFNYVADGMKLYTALKEEPLHVDGREVTCAYYKTATQSKTAGSSVAKQAVAAGQWGVESEPTIVYTPEKIEELAQQSASHYARNPEEHARYLVYYREYYTNESKKNDKSLPGTSSDRSQQQAPLEHLFESKTKDRNLVEKGASGSSATDVSNNSSSWPSGNNPHRGVDMSRFKFDEVTKYYYNPESDLYYDPTTTYFFNPKSQKYQYWDSAAQIFVNVAAGSTDKTTATNKGDKLQQPAQSVQAEDLEKSNDPKKIAKEMEKWAKSLKQKKDSVKTNSAAASGANSSSAANEPVIQSSSKDIPLIEVFGLRASSSKSNNEFLLPYINDLEEESKPVEAQEELLVDYTKMACLLCKRQFSNITQLQKHVDLSDLHKQNLAERSNSQAQNYRDRAEERRKKFGLDKIESSSKLRDMYLKAKKEKETVSYDKTDPHSGIKGDNIGSKMLQKMGWRDGLGLGSKNQGRTDIITAERRGANVGLGHKAQAAVDPDDDRNKYLNPRKVTLARYQELDNS